MQEGHEQMREIASAIRIGANAFIEYEYRVLLRVILVVAVVLGIVTMLQAAVALLIGASMFCMRWVHRH